MIVLFSVAMENNSAIVAKKWPQYLAALIGMDVTNILNILNEHWE